MNHEELHKYKFYHCIELKDGTVTPGRKLYIPIQNMVLNVMDSLSFEGKRVLDVGCRDGLFSFAAEKRGAADVIGIDNDLSRAATEFLIPHLDSKVKMYDRNLFNLTEREFGKFDIIIFAGVLYHLRYPFWALRVIRELAEQGAKLILETGIALGWDQYSLLHCPTPADSPYDPTSVTFFNERGLATTLASLGFTVEYSRLLGEIPNQPGPLRRLFGILHRNERKKDSIPTDRIVNLCTFDCNYADKNLLEYWERNHRTWD